MSEARRILNENDFAYSPNDINDPFNDLKRSFCPK
jgi:hypothetical protein